MGQPRSCKPKAVEQKFNGFYIYEYKNQARCKVHCQWCTRAIVVKGLDGIKVVYYRSPTTVDERMARVKNNQKAVANYLENLGWLVKTGDGWYVPVFDTYCICPFCKPAKLAALEWGKT